MEAGGVIVAVVLIVEDDRIIALDLQRQLTRLGHTVLPPVASAEAALAAVRAHRPGLVLMDVGLSGEQDGLTAGQAIQAMDGTPVIYLSGHVPAQLTAQPRGTGPLFYLLKPVTSEVLARTLEQVFAYAAYQHTFQALQQDVSEHLQHTRALHAAVNALRQAVHESREAVQRRRAEDAQGPPSPPDDPEEEA
jgi:CheY-like chemotaxis protein